MLLSLLLPLLTLLLPLPLLLDPPLTSLSIFANRSSKFPISNSYFFKSFSMAASVDDALEVEEDDSVDDALGVKDEEDDSVDKVSGVDDAETSFAMFSEEVEVEDEEEEEGGYEDKEFDSIEGSWTKETARVTTKKYAGIAGGLNRRDAMAAATVKLMLQQS